MQDLQPMPQQCNEVQQQQQQSQTVGKMTPSQECQVGQPESVNNDCELPSSAFRSVSTKFFTPDKQRIGTDLDQEPMEEAEAGVQQRSDVQGTCTTSINPIPGSTNEAQTENQDQNVVIDDNQQENQENIQASQTILNKDEPVARVVLDLSTVGQSDSQQLVVNISYESQSANFELQEEQESDGQNQTGCLSLGQLEQSSPPQTNSLECNEDVQQIGSAQKLRLTNDQQQHGAEDKSMDTEMEMEMDVEMDVAQNEQTESEQKTQLEVCPGETFVHAKQQQFEQEVVHKEMQSQSVDHQQLYLSTQVDTGASEDDVEMEQQKQAGTKDQIINDKVNLIQIENTSVEVSKTVDNINAIATEKPNIIQTLQKSVNDQNQTAMDEEQIIEQIEDSSDKLLEDKKEQEKKLEEDIEKQENDEIFQRVIDEQKQQELQQKEQRSSEERIEMSSGGMYIDRWNVSEQLLKERDERDSHLQRFLQQAMVNSRNVQAHKDEKGKEQEKEKELGCTVNIEQQKNEQRLQQRNLEELQGEQLLEERQQAIDKGMSWQSQRSQLKDKVTTGNRDNILTRTDVKAKQKSQEKGREKHRQDYFQEQGELPEPMLLTEQVQLSQKYSTSKGPSGNREGVQSLFIAAQRSLTIPHTDQHIYQQQQQQLQQPLDLVPPLENPVIQVQQVVTAPVFFGVILEHECPSTFIVDDTLIHNMCKSPKRKADFEQYSNRNESEQQLQDLDSENQDRQKPQGPSHKTVSFQNEQVLTETVLCENNKRRKLNSNVIKTSQQQQQVNNGSKIDDKEKLDKALNTDEELFSGRGLQEPQLDVVDKVDKASNTDNNLFEKFSIQSKVVNDDQNDAATQQLDEQQNKSLKDDYHVHSYEDRTLQQIQDQKIGQSREVQKQDEEFVKMNKIDDQQQTQFEKENDASVSNLRDITVEEMATKIDASSIEKLVSDDQLNTDKELLVPCFEQKEGREQVNRESPTKKIIKNRILSKLLCFKFGRKWRYTTGQSLRVSMRKIVKRRRRQQRKLDFKHVQVKDVIQQEHTVLTKC
eukprot:TRINITY_DN3625_c1_g1_i2.p1 TRINITY_DN3625_c1_g1~~TRINITY_DN3625_c1_g1_i2.p1  ORF type:complete len:1102 (-),score=169.86 TRINITY_DN3625_c1_g1_i2:61-3186(-)